MSAMQHGQGVSVSIRFEDRASGPIARVRAALRDNRRMVEQMVLVTMNEPQTGAILNRDGERFRIVRVVSWSGTVARLEVERVDDDA